jgi:crossover junction endodeoxyribonuclease RusA
LKKTKKEEAAQTVRFRLPWVPSYNTYYRSVAMGKSVRVLISEKGRKFREDALVAMRGVPALPDSARLALTLKLCAPDRRERDLSNHIKALEDAITHAGIWIDDEQVDKIVVERGSTGRPGHADVEIRVLKEGEDLREQNATPALLSFFLPWPPTTNTYYRSVVFGKRVRVLMSKRGRRFREDALAAMRGIQALPDVARIELTVTLCAPDRRKRDISNHIKALEDAITHAALWLDDSQIDRLVLTRGATGKPGHAHTEIRIIPQQGALK